MQETRIHHWLTLATTVVTAAWVIAWLAGLVIDLQSPVMRIVALGGGLFLTAMTAAIAVRRAAIERLAVERHFEALCQLDPREICGDTVIHQVPPLKSDNSWLPMARRLRDTLTRHCQRVRELELAWTALQVRCHRANTESERIRAILAGLNDPVLAIDEFDEVILANPAAETLLGFDLGAAESRSLGRLVGCPKLAELLASTSRRKSATSRGEEIEVADRQGEVQWYRAVAAKLAGAPNEGDDNAAAGAVVVLHDIATQKTLQKRNAEFVSSVSHEMKTPLAGIKAYVELLADGDAEDDATREEFLAVIDSQADRLRRLVDNLLNLARIEAGVVSVNKQPRALNEVLEEALRVVQPSAEAKQIELTAELSPLYLGVLADRDMLLQAAINLLSNAIKYTPAGGRVTLHSRLLDDSATFEVEDTGVGLSPDDCVKIFEKFYRVKKDKNMAQGTGLGLPLAKHIVEDVHGGRITVDSVPGEGSTFLVTLPLAGQSGVRDSAPPELKPALIA